jgi:hypothetical protein
MAARGEVGSVAFGDAVSGEIFLAGVFRGDDAFAVREGNESEKARTRGGFGGGSCIRLG